MEKASGDFIERLKKRGLGAHLAVLAALAAFLFLSGYVSTLPLTATYDPAMHAEIVDPVISSQIYPLTWSPLAETQYTYPPLFHWLAFLLSGLGIEPIAAVVFLGLVLYAAFPFCLYLLGSFWNRKIALLSAVCGAAISGWTFVFLAGEYPQLLATDLAAVFIYFYLRRDCVKSGILLGLAFLSHPFVPVYLAAFVLAHSFFELGMKNRGFFIASLKCLAIAMAIASVWLPQYFMIVQNAVTNQWGNVRWYYKPGFVGFGELSSMFMSFAPDGRINPAIFVLSLAGAGLVLKKGIRSGKGRGKSHGITSAETAALALFVFTMFFSVFHIPGTQYKFPDMLALAIPPVFAFGISFFSERLGKKNPMKDLFAASVVLIFVFSAYNAGAADFNSHLHKQKYVPTSAAAEAGEWLRNYDPAYSRIVKTGDDEVWFSVISHKYAMDPMITDLEALAGSAKVQLEDRESIIEKIGRGESFPELAARYGIKYVITEGVKSGAGGELVYDKCGVSIYELHGKPG